MKKISNSQRKAFTLPPSQRLGKADLKQDCPGFRCGCGFSGVAAVSPMAAPFGHFAAGPGASPHGYTSILLLNLSPWPWENETEGLEQTANSGSRRKTTCWVWLSMIFLEPEVYVAVADSLLSKQFIKEQRTSSHGRPGADKQPTLKERSSYVSCGASR